MIDKLIEPASNIIGKFVKDKDLQAKLDHELQTLFHQANLAQIEILKEDAKSKNWFQNSWRPFVGWTCGVAMAYHFIIQPLLLTILTATGTQVDLPDFDFAQLSTILMAMLGMSGLRSYEKKEWSSWQVMELGVTKELIDDLKAMLIKNEGIELKPYFCTSNKITIGVGRNLSDNGITKQEADTLLTNDMDNVFADLDRNIPFWKSMPYNVRLALADLCFNLGIRKLCKFSKMLEAMEERDFELAGAELLDSRYAQQVKKEPIETIGS